MGGSEASNGSAEKYAGWVLIHDGTRSIFGKPWVEEAPKSTNWREASKEEVREAQRDEFPLRLCPAFTMIAMVQPQPSGAPPLVVRMMSGIDAMIDEVDIEVVPRGVQHFDAMGEVNRRMLENLADSAAQSMAEQAKQMRFQLANLYSARQMPNPNHR